MTSIIYIIGSFLTAALIFAGFRAINILASKEKAVSKFAEKGVDAENTDFITIKKELLYDLIIRNQELNATLQKAVTNYERSENEINFILNADTENNKDYNNVSSSSHFEYENLTSN
jgi:vacuolar-type H+-ATPase subunit F/Vma7